MYVRSLFLWSLPSTSGKIQKTTEIINRRRGGTILNALKQTKKVDELEKAEGQECSADVTFNLRPDKVESKRAMYDEKPLVRPESFHNKSQAQRSLRVEATTEWWD